MSKVISPILTDGTGMAIAQAINHNTATQLALNTNSYDESETLLEVQDARTINDTQYASLGEGIRAEITRINNENNVQDETLENHTNKITEIEGKANKNITDIANINDSFATVKTATCRLFGGTTEGELSYTSNTATYMVIGKLLFVDYKIVANGVITHPVGIAAIKFDIPEITKATGNASAPVGYVDGGYKECIRRINCCNVSGSGNLAFRSLIIPKTDQQPSLSACQFVNDVSLVTDDKANLHLVDANGKVEVEIRGSFVAMLK